MAPIRHNNKAVLGASLLKFVLFLICLGFLGAGGFSLFLKLKAAGFSEIAVIGSVFFVYVLGFVILAYFFFLRDAGMPEWRYEEEFQAPDAPTWWEERQRRNSGLYVIRDPAAVAPSPVTDDDSWGHRPRTGETPVPPEASPGQSRSASSHSIAASEMREPDRGDSLPPGKDAQLEEKLRWRADEIMAIVTDAHEKLRHCDRPSQEFRDRSATGGIDCVLVAQRIVSALERRLAEIENMLAGGYLRDAQKAAELVDADLIVSADTEDMVTSHATLPPLPPTQWRRSMEVLFERIKRKRSFSYSLFSQD